MRSLASCLPLLLLVTLSAVSGIRGHVVSKRQTETTAHNENEQELCKGRPASEYFRLTADDDCRDVVRCSVQGLLALRCPSGLAFDIEKQTCDWKSNVKNCAQLESEYSSSLLASLPRDVPSQSPCSVLCSQSQEEGGQELLCPD